MYLQTFNLGCTLQDLMAPCVFAEFIRALPQFFRVIHGPTVSYVSRCIIHIDDQYSGSHTRAHTRAYVNSSPEVATSEDTRPLCSRVSLRVISVARISVGERRRRYAAKMAG